MPAVTRHRYMPRNFYPWPDAWTPLSLPNLVAWYDASDAASITASSGAVSQWNDKGPNGYHLVQATGTNQPTTGVDQINSLNAIKFDGVDDFMQWSAAHSNATTTMFIVWKSATQFVIQRIIESADGNRHIIESNGNWRMYQGAFVDSGVSDVATATQITAKLSGTTSSEIRVNGASAATGDAGSGSLGQLRVGIDNDGVSRPAKGDMAEFFFASGVSSAGDVTSAEGYLKTKWGTP